MKKTYVTPEMEKIDFNYREQVVAASNKCIGTYVNTVHQGGSECENYETEIERNSEF